ncbi:MAG: M48 family metallopeptidase [Planctomycetes bacterium]|nr:M48 family metallopeptidase [Planctomycetota bacterium]
MSDPAGTFPGWVIPAGASARQRAEITCTRADVHANVAEGGVLDIPWRDLRLEVGGAEGGMVFCHHRPSGSIVCCDAPGFLAELGRASGGMLDEQLGAVAAQGAASRRRHRIGWTAMVLVVVSLCVGTWILATWGVRHAVESLPPTVDRQIGDQAYGVMDLGGAKEAIPVADAAVATIVERLRTHSARSDFEFRFQLVRSDLVNAFALPGGQIVVYTGLLAKAERAEQVAGVLAHEMAHVTLRHGLHGLAKQAGIAIAFQVLVGDLGGLSGLASQGALSAVINGYSRDAERAADAEGARMMAAAGYDVRGMADFFALLKQQPGSEVPGILAWFSTHPGHDERIASIRVLASRLQVEAPQPIAIDWTAVRAALGKPVAP